MEQIPNLLPNTEKEFILFSLKDKFYGIESLNVLEIIKFMELEIPEKLPNYVAGVIKYDSYYINVTDLKNLFEIEREKYTIDNKILIVTADDSIFGIIADDVIDIKKINKNLIQESPFKNEFSYSTGFCEIDKKNITILNLNAIDNKIKTSISASSQQKFSLGLYPDNEKEIEVLKKRKFEFQKKSDIGELINYCIEQDAISFEIEGNKYCTDISNVKNFYKLKPNDAIVKLPISKDFILGLLNIKGEFTTIIDLQKFLGFGKTKIKEGSIIIILFADDFKIGILADKIGEKIDIKDELENKKFGQNSDNNEELVNIVRNNNIYTVISPQDLFKAEKFQY